MYTCTLCKNTKADELFPSYARREIKKTGQCRECLKTKAQAYNTSERGRAIRSDFQKRYEKNPKRVAYNQARKSDSIAYSKVYHRLPERRFKEGVKQALSRGIPWLLSEPEHQSLIKGGVCQYCSGPMASTGCGLDRVDSSGPYSVLNCVPCCKRCNTMKSNDLTYDEMLAVAKLLKGMRI